MSETIASAQDDGARVYLPAPVDSKVLTIFSVVKRGNEEPEPGDVIQGSDIATDTLVFRYAQTFRLAGRQFTPFLILPFGRVRASTPAEPETEKSAGIGDIQLGAALSLFGAPALAKAAYAVFKPGPSIGLLGKVFFPTGAYSSTKPVNFGANRFAYQIGLPMTLPFGSSYLDPSLTLLEILPSVTFYSNNNDPFGATFVEKDPLYGVETHLSRNFGARFWLSADVLYRQGGETKPDGMPAGDPTRGWAVGGSAAFTLLPSAKLLLTYEHSVARSDSGPDGWFFRTAVVLPFG